MKAFCDGVSGAPGLLANAPPKNSDLELQLLDTVAQKDDLLVFLIDRHGSDGLEAFPSTGAGPLRCQDGGLDESGGCVRQDFGGRHGAILGDPVLRGRKPAAEKPVSIQLGGWSRGRWTTTGGPEQPML